jgi:glycosyltransferase involved in cell wall biosynthesis
MHIIPIVMIKNEELWIEKVLTPLTKVFPGVIVADTGSTDNTIQIVSSIKGVRLMRFIDMTLEQIGQCRGTMQAEAKRLFGATHVMLVDGDELYPTTYLRWLTDNPMPECSLSGYTYGVECTELANGECWLLGNQYGVVGVNRQAFFSVDVTWKGTYPFESPSSYKPGDANNYYWKVESPLHRFFHIHQMKRSSKDDDVYMRRQKQYQFALQIHPEIKPLEFWLKSREDYKDV